jgi:uncharacterized membrane protein
VKLCFSILSVALWLLPRIWWFRQRRGRPIQVNSMLWLHVVSYRSVAPTLCGHSIAVSLSVLRLLIGAALFFVILGLFLTVLLFPRTQDLYGLERVLTAVITSILVSLADATFLFVKAWLNFATLELIVFSVSAMFVDFAYVWEGREAV